MNTVSLASSSMLARLSISVYTGRILDKKVTAEVQANKGAQGRVGNYNKQLFSDSPKLDAINKLAANVRNWHKSNTLPWEDDGARLLPTKHFFDHREKLGAYETEFNNLVEDFLADYGNQISIQAFKLGTMFDKNEYPDPATLKAKYSFSVVYSPVPESGDFRVDIASEAKEELKEQYEAVYKVRVETAMKDAWGRLEDALKHIAERLTPDEEGGNKSFRKSMLENLGELLDVLPKFNITNDAKLDSVCLTIKSLLSTVTPKELRESAPMRADVKNQVEELLKKMST